MIGDLFRWCFQINIPTESNAFPTVAGNLLLFVLFVSNLAASCISFFRQWSTSVIVLALIHRYAIKMKTGNRYLLSLLFWASDSNNNCKINNQKDSMQPRLGRLLDRSNRLRLLDNTMIMNIITFILNAIEYNYYYTVR